MGQEKENCGQLEIGEEEDRPWFTWYEGEELEAISCGTTNLISAAT